jgi:hypothetical protein
MVSDTRKRGRSNTAHMTRQGCYTGGGSSSWTTAIASLMIVVLVLLLLLLCVEPSRSFRVAPPPTRRNGKLFHLQTSKRNDTNAAVPGSGPSSTNGDDGDHNNGNGTAAAQEFDDDFSAWLVANLKSWPLLPSSASATITGNASLSPTLNDDTGSVGPSVVDYVGQGGGISVVTDLDTWNRTNPTPDESFFLTSSLSRVFNIDSLVQLTLSSATMSSSLAAAAASAVIGKVNWTALQELGSLDRFVEGMVQTTGKSAEVLFKTAATRMESLVVEASSTVSPEMMEALIRKSSEIVYNVTKLSTTINVSDMAYRGAESSSSSSTTYAMSLLQTADGLFRKGYIAGDQVSMKIRQSKQSILKNVPVIAGSRALFDSFDSAYELNLLSPTIIKAAEMGALSGAIYEDTVSRTRGLGQTIVARGTSQDVAWMVSDSIANPTSFRDGISIVGGAGSDATAPFLVRTITIRGFDASDESVDRELLLNRVCTATPVPLFSKLPGFSVHSGLLEIARAIYQDLKPFLDWTAPTHRIVLNGHSIGGSISLLLLFLMIKDNGAEYVKNNVVKVYTFGCPPIAVLQGSNLDILSALELPISLVQGFIQPWDPIVRLFSRIDALYPLVGDLGPDDMTPYANGPPRTLRPILKAVIESWDGWPRFRDIYRGTANQTYTSVGVQHLLLPDPTRYLADRFVAMNIPVPPVETVLRISNRELYPALTSVFPLDVFEVSFVPQAIRSFVHHFYPAYGSPLLDYVKDLQRKSRGKLERQQESVLAEEGSVANSAMATPSAVDGGIDWSKATQWLVRNNAKP